ncbi:hypothetical protein Tco_1535734, partial [Tanacetum coccineum]
MLRVFLITLTGAAKRWVDRLPLGSVDSRDLLKKAFIQSRSIKGSSSEGIIAIVNKLENLGRDMKKLKENVHTIQVGCQTCEGAHLDKDYPLNEEVKGMEEPSSGEKRPILTEAINKYIKEASKRQAEQDERLKKFYQSTEANQETHDKIIQGLEGKVKTLSNEVEGRANNKKISDNEEQETNDSGMAESVAALEATLKKKIEEPKKVKYNVNYYVDPYEPPIPFPKRLEHHAEEAL